MDGVYALVELHHHQRFGAPRGGSDDGKRNEPLLSIRDKVLLASKCNDQQDVTFPIVDEVVA